MKRLLVACSAAVGIILLASSLCLAADIKIGYVDFNRVRAESKAGIAAVKSVETMLKDKQAQLDQRQKELEKLLSEVEKGSSLLSEDVKRQKEDKLQKDYKDFQRFKTDSEEEIEKKRNEILKQINDELVAVISKFGKEEGYTLILDRSVVLYAPEAVDVTDKVIKAYDASRG